MMPVDRPGVGHDHRPSYMNTSGEDPRSLGDLFSELMMESRTLVRQEIDLARLEALQRAKKAGKNSGMVGAGGFVAYAGFIVFLIGLASLLGTFMPDWIGAMIVGVLAIAGGYFMINSGIEGLKKTDWSLPRTAETIKEDKEWLQKEMK